MAKPRADATRTQPAGASKTGRSAAKPSPSNRPNGRVVFGGGLLLVLALVGAVAVVATRGGGTEGAAAAQMEHVHGLGVDPADDTLYAGTHYGLFRVPGQSPASRVAERVQDFMGFTVAGPGHYLASGHPGAGQDGPAHLGLIESTDGGQSWQTLSLAGEADFHALEARHGRVYGFNGVSGAFMVSEDKRSWDIRNQTPMADLAVSPEDPDVLVATTGAGLQISEDGGREFAQLPSAPRLLLVSWAEDGTLLGLEQDGTVHASTDDGQNWSRRGSIEASPNALYAASESEFFVAVDGAILTSTDGGASFTTYYEDQ